MIENLKDLIEKIYMKINYQGGYILWETSIRNVILHFLQAGYQS